MWVCLGVPGSQLDRLGAAKAGEVDVGVRVPHVGPDAEDELLGRELRADSDEALHSERHTSRSKRHAVLAAEREKARLVKAAFFPTRP